MQQSNTPEERKQNILQRLEDMKQLNQGRYDFVLERAKRPQPSVEDACTSIGYNRSWFYRFSEQERKDLDHLAEDLHKDQSAHAFIILNDAQEEAAIVKTSGLRSRNEKIKQDASTEILNRTLGKPGETVKHEGTINFTWNPHKPPTLPGNS